MRMPLARRSRGTWGFRVVRLSKGEAIRESERMKRASIDVLRRINAGRNLSQPIYRRSWNATRTPGWLGARHSGKGGMLFLIKAKLRAGWCDRVTVGMNIRRGMNWRMLHRHADPIGPSSSQPLPKTQYRLYSRWTLVSLGRRIYLKTLNGKDQIGKGNNRLQSRRLVSTSHSHGHNHE